MAMLRAGADIVGYELRGYFAAKAQANVESFLGPDALTHYRVELRVYDGIDERVIWTGLCSICRSPGTSSSTPKAPSAVGGIFFAYVPSTVQVAQLREALDDSDFAMVQTNEVLQRGPGT